MRLRINAILAALTLGLLSACTVHPQGESQERSKALQAGAPYQRPFEERRLTPLAPDASLDDLVTYALLANAQLEQRYWEWRSAIEQIPQEGTQKTNLMLSFTSMITNGASAAGNNTLGVGNDPMNGIVLPQKLSTAARMALTDAQAAGLRFDKSRLEMRSQVLAAYADYSLTAETIRLQSANNDLLQMTVNFTSSRVATGNAQQQDLLKAANEYEMAVSTLKSTTAKLATNLATLNALLNRAPDSPLTPPPALPAPRQIVENDAHIFALATENNPELHAQNREISGRQIAIDRARQEYIPDIGVNLSTDLAGATQTILASVSTPLLRYQAIDGQLNQAKANLHAADAQRRQAVHDLSSEVAADLAAIRDTQRQADLFEGTVLPRAQQVVIAQQNAYGNGHATLLELLDAQRSLIALRQTIAELRVEREKRLANLEALTARSFSIADGTQ